jgi:ammonium transporter Rh
MARSFTMLLGFLQLTLLILFLACTTYDDTRDYSAAEYAIFRDIMVMLLLGFGFLMTFLRKYGLGAVGLTMMLTVISMQLNLFMEPLARHLYGSDVEYPLELNVASLIDGEFSAATLLISYGVVIGRASPTQLLTMAFFQSIFYAINKAMIVFGALGAEDVGGTITIHLFGAYFGIAVSRAFSAPKQFSSQNNESSAVSDVLSMIGTALLWVYWPSFVGATETASPRTENLCIIHTVLALLGSTSATFFLSHALLGKFNPVHVANSTLAGKSSLVQSHYLCYYSRKKSFVSHVMYRQPRRRSGNWGISPSCNVPRWGLLVGSFGWPFVSDWVCVCDSHAGKETCSL